MTAITVAVLFLACLFIAPLAGVVPAYATAPALLYVSCLMLREMVEVPWDDATEAVPAALTALLMPFTYSIANGVAFGFIAYGGLKLLTGGPLGQADRVAHRRRVPVPLLLSRQRMTAALRRAA